MQARFLKLTSSLFSILWMLTVVYCFYYLIRTVSSDLEGQTVVFKGILSETKTWLLFCVLVFLMLINWLLESLKWQLCVSDFYPITTWYAIKSQMAGVAISTWMPNRVGDYLGKIFYMPNQLKAKAAISSVYTSYVQNVTVIMFGLSGGIFFLNSRFSVSTGYLLAIGVLILAVPFLLFVPAYFRNKRQRFSFFTPLQVVIKHFGRYTSTLNLKMFALSILRFSIFNTQFYLCLTLMGVEVPFVESFLLVSFMYGILTFLPTTALASLGIRGVISISLFSVYSDASANIVAASYAIWLINLFVPSIVGLYFLLQAPSRPAFSFKTWILSPVKIFRN